MDPKLLWVAVAESGELKSEEDLELKVSYGTVFGTTRTSGKPPVVVPLNIGLVTDQPSHTLVVTVFDPMGKVVQDYTETLDRAIPYQWEDALGQELSLMCGLLLLRFPANDDGIYIFNAVIEGKPLFSIGHPLRVIVMDPKIL